MFTLHCRSKKAKNQSGFTLIELMVTIMVMAILATIAGPSMQRSIANYRVRASTATIEAALEQAKAESTIRKKNVQVTYDVSKNAVSVILQQGAGNSIVLASHQLNNGVNVSLSPAGSIIFQPTRKTTESSFNVCSDKFKTDISRQIVISAIGNIETKLSGTCS